MSPSFLFDSGAEAEALTLIRRHGDDALRVVAQEVNERLAAEDMEGALRKDRVRRAVALLLVDGE